MVVRTLCGCLAEIEPDYARYDSDAEYRAAYARWEAAWQADADAHHVYCCSDRREGGPCREPEHGLCPVFGN